jgi:hypothetical protein
MQERSGSSIPQNPTCQKTMVRGQSEKIRNLEHGAWWRFSRITILDRMKPRQSLKRPSFSPIVSFKFFSSFASSTFVSFVSHTPCQSFCAAILSLPVLSLRSRAFPSLRPRRSQQHAQLHHLPGFSGLQRPTFTLTLHTIRDFRVILS